MGYHRSIDSWNIGKKSEFKERKYFKEGVALNSLAKYEGVNEDGRAKVA